MALRKPREEFLDELRGRMAPLALAVADSMARLRQLPAFCAESVWLRKWQVGANKVLATLRRYEQQAEAAPEGCIVEIPDPEDALVEPYKMN